MARWQFRPPIERTKQGFRINIDEREREVVRHLLEEMRSLLLGSSDHPALKRVFPAAYHQAQHAEQERQDEQPQESECARKNEECFGSRQDVETDQHADVERRADHRGPEPIDAPGQKCCGGSARHLAGEGNGNSRSGDAGIMASLTR